jgi:2,4-dienoyl-CoA reductase-like NADH-dependent reductase (Old Yellow Enzyme family)
LVQVDYARVVDLDIGASKSDIRAIRVVTISERAGRTRIEGWRKITDAVDARDGKMFSQLWHTGRSSHVEMTYAPMPGSTSSTASDLRTKTGFGLPI